MRIRSRHWGPFFVLKLFLLTCYMSRKLYNCACIQRPCILANTNQPSQPNLGVGYGQISLSLSLSLYIYIYRFPRNFLRTKKLNNINTSIYQMLLRKVQAALLALKLSVHHHLSFVLFEGDSKTVIEALRRSSPQIFLFLLSLQFWLPIKKMLGLLFYT